MALFLLWKTNHAVIPKGKQVIKFIILYLYIYIYIYVYVYFFHWAIIYFWRLTSSPKNVNNSMCKTKKGRGQINKEFGTFFLLKDEAKVYNRIQSKQYSFSGPSTTLSQKTLVTVLGTRMLVKTRYFRISFLSFIPLQDIDSTSVTH